MSWTRITPLGDQAVLANFADEAGALMFAANVRQAAPVWLIDIVQAYTSVAVFYDTARADYEIVGNSLTELDAAGAGQPLPPGKLHIVPCCYELGLDLKHVAEHKGLGVEDVIRLHSQTMYTVYAIGFCPGFPFLGYLPEPLCGVPRLQTPRLRVEAGTVGLTGRQTGIYTEPRPAGWNLVGRTPLQLVDVLDGYFPLRTGDRIQFARINAREFDELRGRRLESGLRQTG